MLINKLPQLASTLSQLVGNQVQVRYLNANRCAVTKIKRSKFARLYPTMAVLPDGSSITSKVLSCFHRFLSYCLLQLSILNQDS